MAAGRTARPSARVATSGTASGTSPTGGSVTSTPTRTARPQTESPRQVLTRFLGRPMTSFYLILAVSAALLALGLVMITSASSVESIVKFGNPYSQFHRQFAWAAIGLVALWFGIRLRPSFYRRLGGPAMVLSILLLVAVLVPGIGVRLNGARSWFDLGGLSLQPSELAKAAFVLWGADLLVRKEKLLGQWRHLLVPLLPGLGLIALLLLLEPDLGTTGCFVLIFLALLWTVGTPVRLFVAMFVAMVGAGAVAVTMAPYRFARIDSFLNPEEDPLRTGYQALQSLYALGSGGWFGVGLGNSRAKWGLLPNEHSDFIFAIIGEELGLVGCVVVLLLFAAFAYSGFRIARRTVDPFIRLTASAITVWLVGQALINVLYVVGLLPVTGLTLPFISSGGTSLVLTMFVVGILASFARHEPAAVKHLQRRKSRFGRLLGFPVPAAPHVAGRRRTAARTPATAARTATTGRRRPAPARTPSPRTQPAHTRAPRTQPARTQAPRTQSADTQAPRMQPARSTAARPASARTTASARQSPPRRREPAARTRSAPERRRAGR